MRLITCLTAIALVGSPVIAQIGPQQVISNVAHGARAVETADLDGDGDLDVLSASYIDGKIAWYENLGVGGQGSGFGGFGPEQVISNSVFELWDVCAADLDGDGDAEVIRASYGLGIHTYENLGGGTFGPPEPVSFGPLQRAAQMVEASDLDGDGDVDLLFGSEDTSGPMYYSGEGDGSFFFIPLGTDSFWHGCFGVGTSDINGDGATDMLGSSWEGLAWYRGEDVGGGGTAFDTMVVAYSDNFFFFTNVVGGDLDGDGDSDLLVSLSGSEISLVWYENLGGGDFGDPWNGNNQQDIATFAAGILDVSLADLDGDGDGDLLCTSPTEDKILWYENLGGGSFGPQQVITTSANGVAEIHSADVDGDGDPDILSANYGSNTVAWHENLFGVSPWLDLGHALAGLSGEPVLTGSGTLEPDTAVTLTLSNAMAHMPSYLVIGTGISSLPCLGGVMVPSPGNWAFAFTGSGGATLEGRWPPGMPSGVNAYLQWWILDAGGPEGFAASNALKLTGQ